VGLDHEFACRIAQSLLADCFKRLRIETVGRADLVECVKNVVEGIDSYAGLRMDRTAAEIGKHSAGTPHRPGREAVCAGLFLGNEFRRAHECIPVMHAAVRERKALNEPIAVKQMRLAQITALEKAGTVAIERTAQFARNLAFDSGSFVAPALFRYAEER
jgi:hypothetical protein